MQKAAVLGVWAPPGPPARSHACAGLWAMLLAGVWGRPALLLRALLRPGVRASEGASKLPHAAVPPLRGQAQGTFLVPVCATGP